MGLTAKQELIQHLQKEILSLQGVKRPGSSQAVIQGLEFIEAAFPERFFPTGAVHEFISPTAEDATATNGFIAGLLGQLMNKGGACLWVSNSRKVNPSALNMFGIATERIIFIDLTKPKDALWAIEEGLKCEALSAVVGEIKDLGFNESRRLQLAVENSRVTGFIHRHQPRSENIVACMTRWKIKAIASKTEEGMPGMGYPRWNVQLMKVRNGKPGCWQIEWAEGNFRPVEQDIARSQEKVISMPDIAKRKTG